jgi:hypothetical protein
MYLYNLENNTKQIQQADVLIYELFNKSVHTLKENIDKQEIDLQNLSVSLIFSSKEKIYSSISFRLVSVLPKKLFLVVIIMN